MSQAKRYATLQALTERENEKLDCSYHAAFYLLSGNADICDKAYNFVDNDGIDFEGLIKSSQNLDEPQQQLLSVAHNLFSWTSDMAVTPFDISRMGHPYMELVCNAIYIASGEYAVRMELDGQNRPALVLDTSRHERTRHIHANLERMIMGQAETPYDEGFEQ